MTRVSPVDDGSGEDQRPSVGTLASSLSEQMSLLVRQELALAKAEATETAKHAGKSAGLFSGAGVLALYGIGVLLAAAVLGLSHVVSAWLAAVIVGVVLLVVAGIVALVGRREVAQVTPPVGRTVRTVKEDVTAVKEASRR